MELHQIENLTAAEIKSQQAELVEAAKNVSADYLAGRYVQARLDAKLRDEKLGEQGVKITALEESLREAESELAEALKTAGMQADQIHELRSAAGERSEKLEAATQAVREQAATILRLEAEVAALKQPAKAGGD